MHLPVKIIHKYISYLRKSSVGEFLEEKFVLFSGSTFRLSFEDSSRRNSRQSHTVADEYNHIFRTVLIVL